MCTFRTAPSAPIATARASTGTGTCSGCRWCKAPRPSTASSSTRSSGRPASCVGRAKRSRAACSAPCTKRRGDPRRFQIRAVRRPSNATALRISRPIGRAEDSTRSLHSWSSPSTSPSTPECRRAQARRLADGSCAASSTASTRRERDGGSSTTRAGGLSPGGVATSRSLSTRWPLLPR